MSDLSTRCRNPLVRARLPDLSLSLSPRLTNWYDFSKYGENYLVDVTQMWRSPHLMAFLMKILTSRHQMEFLWDVICWDRAKILLPSVMLFNSPKTSTRVFPKMRYVVDDTSRQIMKNQRRNSLLQAVLRSSCFMAMLETMATGSPLPKCSSFACDAMY